MKKARAKAKRTEIKFKLRSTAVAIRNGKVLIYQYEGSEYWSLPGGRMNPDEDSRQALIREMAEEANLQIRIERLLWISENFYLRANGKKIHEVSFYYLVTADGAEDGEFQGREGDARLFFRWVDIHQLNGIPLVPAFLKLSLADLPATPEHIITRKIKP
ncbi:MAG: NUDIX hydrolase [Anaerolineae bacterium]|nr:NUDIX hydrolase [Anaerolineae bacterium]